MRKECKNCKKKLSITESTNSFFYEGLCTHCYKIIKKQKKEKPFWEKVFDTTWLLYCSGLTLAFIRHCTGEQPLFEGVNKSEIILYMLGMYIGGWILFFFISLIYHSIKLGVRRIFPKK